MSTIGLIAILCGAGAVALRSVLPETHPHPRDRLVWTPRTLIARLRPGRARVVGRVQGRGALLRAPLSDRPCLGYEIRVGHPGMDDVPVERPICRLRRMTAFTLVDETGEVLIDPAEGWQPVIDPHDPETQI